MYARVALLCLPLALLVACQRGAPAAATNQAAPQLDPGQRLMPRGRDQRERADMSGDNRIRCKEPVPSIPCTP